MPLARTTTQSQATVEVPNRPDSNDRPVCIGRGALSESQTQELPELMQSLGDLEEGRIALEPVAQTV